jgi:hypothetical protein
LYRGVDPASRRRIQIFAVKLLVIIPVAVTLATQLGYPLLKTPWFFCLWHSFFAGMAALFRQQKHGAAVLAAGIPAKSNNAFNHFALVGMQPAASPPLSPEFPSAITRSLLKPDEILLEPLSLRGLFLDIRSYTDYPMAARYAPPVAEA